jgi:hypothetical protein
MGRFCLDWIEFKTTALTLLLAAVVPPTFPLRRPKAYLNLARRAYCQSFDVQMVLEKSGRYDQNIFVAITTAARHL